MYAEAVGDIIARHPEPDGQVAAILEDIQKKYRHLPEEALHIVAEKLGLPLPQLYGVATFYTGFSLSPKGEHVVCVCHGTTCHVKGAKLLSEHLEKEFGVKAGQTTADGAFTLEVVRCLGCCSLAPVVSVDGKTYGGVKRGQVPELLADWKGGR